MDVRVAAAGSDDRDVVRDLRLAALAGAPDAFCATLASELALDGSTWQRRVEDPDRTTLVAWIGDHPAGMAMVGPWSEDEVEAAATITGVWVAPAGRGHGVGDALLVAAIGVAAARGFERVMLEVGDDNGAAQRLYARHGFVATGRTSTMPLPKQHVTEHELARDL